MNKLTEYRGQTLSTAEADFLKKAGEIFEVKFHRGANGYLNAIEVKARKRAHGPFAGLYQGNPPVEQGYIGTVDYYPTPTFTRWARELSQSLKPDVSAEKLQNGSAPFKELPAKYTRS